MGDRQGRTLILTCLRAWSRAAHFDALADRDRPPRRGQRGVAAEGTVRASPPAEPRQGIALPSPPFFVSPLAEPVVDRDEQAIVC
ncbi:MAG: hypothetical protein QOF30_2122 [Acidimicrobiaceae bacterium]|jgi:hypothetical protein|nr:hypothetical protein [Acidimicrobiaceae bacterium]